MPDTGGPPHYITTHQGSSSSTASPFNNVDDNLSQSVLSFLLNMASLVFQMLYIIGSGLFWSALANNSFLKHKNRYYRERILEKQNRVDVRTFS